jgi:hypothetical protein
MSIGDIQLTKAAMSYASAGPTAASDGGAVVIGETERDTEQPDELRNTALPRQQVEDFLWEIQNQPAWRREADRCADYYDGNQLSPETAEKLESRGQPPLIDNLIKPTIDTVLGMEAKTRTDWRVRPEDEMVSDDLAEALSLKLKQAETESRADRACSDAYAAELKAGIGWVEVARESDPFKFPYRCKYVHRREIAWDWRAESYNLDDARYLVRRRWLDVENAIAMMPQYASLFRNTVNAWSGFNPLLDQDTKLIQSFELERDTRLSTTDWRDVNRQRVCLYEIWYRKWVRGYVMTLPNGRVVEVDFENRRHTAAIVAGIVKIKQATFQKVRLAWYCGPHFLYDVPSPYKHNHFPYVPFFGYREDLTQVPYGLIRSMISPQDEVNARKSKMLWQLNSRRVVTDEDAVKDHTVAAREVARADSYVILNKDRKPTSQFKVEQGGELAAQQFQAMQEAKQTIAEASGVHKPMLGQAGSGTSGLAINSLFEAGTNSLAEINDNYRYARRMVGELLFSLMQDDLTVPNLEVQLGEGSRKRVIVLNKVVVDPATGQQGIENDVAKVRAKVVLDDIPSSPTFRMQQLQMLTEITKALPPQAQGLIIDFYISATDLPNKERVADRLRRGLNLPDDTPEAQQAQQQAAKQQLEQQQKLAMLEMAEKQAKIDQLNADTQQKIADLQGQGGTQEAIARAVAEVQAQATEHVNVLQGEMETLRKQLVEKEAELANRQAEISSKAEAEATRYLTELEKARIAGNADIAVAKVEAADREVLRQVQEQLAEANRRIEELAKSAKEPAPTPSPEPKSEVTPEPQAKKQSVNKKVKFIVENDRIVGAEIMES